MFDLQPISTSLRNDQRFTEYYDPLEEYFVRPQIVNNTNNSHFNYFEDIPGISYDVLIRLEAIGIKKTLQLYEEVLTPECRIDFSRKTGINPNEVLKLTKYTDLSRIKYVNHILVYLLCKTGYDSPSKVAKANPSEMFIKLMKRRSKRNMYPVIEESYLSMVIELAKKLKQDIEYY